MTGRTAIAALASTGAGSEDVSGGGPMKTGSFVLTLAPAAGLAACARRPAARA